MIPFLDLGGGIDGAFDDIIERGAGADAGEVGPEVAADAADGVAHGTADAAVDEFPGDWI